MTPAPRVDVRRGADRFTTRLPWLEARRSFSFGQQYDPGNVSYGALLAHNEDVVQPGAGYDAHPHRDVEIVTWVLEGELVHEEAGGRRGVVPAGSVQRLSAGTGVVHAERNEGPGPVRFVQMWLAPDEAGGDPGYERREVDLPRGTLVPVVSGLAGHEGAVGLRSRGAALHAGRLEPGDAVQLPAAPYAHVFVARGAVTLDGTGILASGDAVRLTATRGRLTASEPAEVLVWEMHGPVRAW